MDLQTITRKGKRFVLLPVEQFQRLAEADLPPLPKRNPDGTVNAIEFTRVAIARTLINDRRAAGLSQQELARLAGVRQETISRIESGKRTATVRVIDKLDRALRRAAKIKTKRA